MQEVDLKTWNRRDHFAVFRRVDLPFYNVSANVDATGLRSWVRTRAVSLNNTLIYAVMTAINGIENFRYRLRGDTVVLYDRLHPSFSCLRQGEELFRMIAVDLADDPIDFDARAKAAIAASTAYFDAAMAGRDDVVFISPMPWIVFTSVDHTVSLRREDAIPRVTWGKLFEENGRTMLPFNIQVNHMFVDGLHVGRLFAALSDGIAAVQARS